MHFHFSEHLRLICFFKLSVIFILKQYDSTKNKQHIYTKSCGKVLKLSVIVSKYGIHALNFVQKSEL